MNIKKTDVLELRRRMTKKSCTITRLSGCYVDGDKHVLLKFSRPFSDLEEEEFFKYLEIAKKVLSGSLANNLLELSFQRGETGDECQRSLYALKSSGLQDQAMLDRFYDRIVESYDAGGNYLILVFHDVYDVVAKAKDRRSLGESTETYTYMLCAVCPVDFSKAGLSYREADNSIGVSDRFWLVGAPEIGFTYPAFANRGADSSAVMYYVKTGKSSHPEFISEVLCCDAQRTAGEEKAAFRKVIEDVFEDPQQGESVYLKFQKRLSDMTMPDPGQEESEPLPLTKAVMADVTAQVEMPEEAREIIQDAFADQFGDLPPQAQHLVDQKLVEESEQRLRTLELEDQVTDLKEALDVRSQELTQAKREVQEARAANLSTAPGEDVAIAMRVSPQKAKKIHAQMIQGIKYLVVPLEKGDATQINGESFDF